QTRHSDKPVTVDLEHRRSLQPNAYIDDLAATDVDIGARLLTYMIVHRHCSHVAHDELALGGMNHRRMGISLSPFIRRPTLQRARDIRHGFLQPFCEEAGGRE